jgi:hypothetical protein
MPWPLDALVDRDADPVLLEFRREVVLDDCHGRPDGDTRLDAEDDVELLTLAVLARDARDADEEDPCLGWELLDAFLPGMGERCGGLIDVRSRLHWATESCTKVRVKYYVYIGTRRQGGFN